MLVQALDFPPQHVIRGTYGIQKYTLVFIVHEQSQSRKSVVDKIMERDEPVKSSADFGRVDRPDIMHKACNLMTSLFVKGRHAVLNT